MKYLLISLLILVMGVGCRGGNDDADFGLSIHAIDSCEYVIYVNSNRGSTSMVHSGNCHNPKHLKQ